MREDPERRLGYHNTIEKGFTSRYRPWELVFKYSCKSREEARQLEKKIKGWKSKAMIRKLLRGEISLSS